MKHFFQQNKKIIVTLLFVVVLSCGFLLLADVHPVAAEMNIWSMIKEGFWSAIVWLGNLVRFIFGKLLLVLLKLLVFVGSYNGFTSSPYVKSGWKILRDVVNMFFILGLLFIAFVTVLKIEKYQWNKFLGRLLIMAILVNFSNTICGLIIDFFQVLMLTFVNSFRDIAEGTIFKGLQITSTVTVPVVEGPDIEGNAGMMAAAATILGAAFIVVACLVVGIFTIMLAFRIVALWMLIVVSPLAFFSYAFESVGGKIGSISSRWWTHFFNYCMIGPFMAFFLWLALITMASASAYGDTTTLAAYKFCETTLCSAEQLVPYVMGILMLIGGLMMSGEFAVAGSGLATRAASSIKNTAQNLAERSTIGLGTAATVGLATYGAKGAYTNILAPLGRGISDRYQRAGGVLGIGKSAATRTMARTKAWGERMERKGTKVERIEGNVMTGEGLKVISSTNLLGKLGRTAKRGVEGMEKGGAALKSAYKKPGQLMRDKIDQLEAAKNEQYAKVGAAGTSGAEQRAALGKGVWSSAKQKLYKGLLKGGALGETALTAPFKYFPALTAEGRKHQKEMLKSSIYGVASGNYRERRDEQKRRSDELMKKRAVDPKNMSKIGDLIDQMTSGQIAYSEELMEGLLRAYSQGGKLTEDKLKDVVKKTGFMRGKDPLEAGMLFEEYENNVEQKTGYRPSFSNWVFNDKTNVFEDIDAMEKAKGQAISSMRSKGYVGGMTEDEIATTMESMDMTKLMKADKHGTYRIDKDSDEFKRLSGGSSAEQNVLNGLSKSQVDYEKYLKDLGLADATGKMIDSQGKNPLRLQHQFFAVARAGEIQTMRSKERRTNLSRGSSQQSQNFHNTTNSLSAAALGAGVAFDQLVGVAANVKQVGHNSPEGNSRGNLRARALVGDNTERLEVYRKDKDEFKKEIAELEKETGKSLENMTETDLDGSSFIKKIDIHKNRLSIEQHESIQKYIKATSAEYDADDRLIVGKEGEKSVSLDNYLAQRRSKEGASAKVEQEVKTVFSEATASTANQDPFLQDLINDLPAILQTTKGQDKKERIDALRKIISDKLNQQGVTNVAQNTSMSDKLADKLLDLEADMEKQTSAASDLKTDSSKDLQSILSGLETNVSAAKASGNTADLNQPMINFAFETFLGKLKKQIQNSGLPANSINVSAIKKKFDDITQNMANYVTKHKVLNDTIEQQEQALETAVDEAARKLARDRIKDAKGKLTTLTKKWDEDQRELQKLIK